MNSKGEMANTPKAQGLDSGLADKLPQSSSERVCCWLLAACDRVERLVESSGDGGAIKHLLELEKLVAHGFGMLVREGVVGGWDRRCGACILSGGPGAVLGDYTEWGGWGVLRGNCILCGNETIGCAFAIICNKSKPPWRVCAAAAKLGAMVADALVTAGRSRAVTLELGPATDSWLRAWISSGHDSVGAAVCSRRVRHALALGSRHVGQDVARRCRALEARGVRELLAAALCSQKPRTAGAELAIASAAQFLSKGPRGRCGARVRSEDWMIEAACALFEPTSSLVTALAKVESIAEALALLERVASEEAMRKLEAACGLVASSEVSAIVALWRRHSPTAACASSARLSTADRTRDGKGTGSSGDGPALARLEAAAAANRRCEFDKAWRILSEQGQPPVDSRTAREAAAGRGDAARALGLVEAGIPEPCVAIVLDRHTPRLLVADARSTECVRICVDLSVKLFQLFVVDNHATLCSALQSLADDDEDDDKRRRRSDYWTARLDLEAKACHLVAHLEEVLGPLLRSKFAGTLAATLTLAQLRSKCAKLGLPKTGRTKLHMARRLADNFDGDLRLLLDPYLQLAPIEALPSLKHACVIRTVLLTNCTRPASHPVDPAHILALIDPDGDLPTTRTNILQALESLEYRRMTRHLGFDQTHASVFSDSREPHDYFQHAEQDTAHLAFFLYCGHGAGTRFWRRRLLHPPPLALLMGCSSANCVRSRDLPAQFPPPPHILLRRGAAAVLALLWDVSDRDIDKLTLQLLISLRADSAINRLPCCRLASVLSRARHLAQCKTPVLNAFATVCFAPLPPLPHNSSKTTNQHSER